MAWNSPLTRWHKENPWTPATAKTVEKSVPSTEKRSISLSDPNFLKYFRIQPNTLADVDVTHETTLGITAFYGAIRIISESIAMLDRKVMQRKTGEVSESDSHPLVDFFRERPHPYYSWFDFFAALISNAMFGNGYARIHRDEETWRPMYLEHIPGWMVRVECDMAGTIWYLISGTLNGKTIIERVPHTEMVHIKGFTLDGVAGLDTLWLHGPTFGVGVAETKYAGSVMGKGAHPSIAIKVDEELDEREAKNLEENFMSRHGGSANAGRPLVLDNGQNVQYLQWSPLDVALEQLRHLTVEDVSRITKVPLYLLSMNKYGTYGTAQQMSEDFLRHTLGPWIEKIQEEFNAKLFTSFEFRTLRAYFEFDTSPYVSVDREAETKMYAEAIRSTQMTPNEVRIAKGLPPLDGGDELMVDVNLLPVSQAAQIAYAKYLSSEGEKAVGGMALSGKSEQVNPDASPQNEGEK